MSRIPTAGGIAPMVLPGDGHGSYSKALWPAQHLDAVLVLILSDSNFPLKCQQNSYQVSSLKIADEN
eukprot:SAG11_NODE_471_length_9197_cov_292.216751_1_plen_67_part_00